MILQITKPALREPQKLCVVYSGVDPERYAGKPVQNVLRKEFSIPTEYSLIGNLSALADHKDYPTFIKTAREVLKQGFKAKFIIAGDGPEKEQIKSLIHTNGLEKDVLMIGFRQDVTAVMQSLDIFLMTSKTEGLGTILIEAFMAGVPVVATNAGGIPELVKNGQTGLICDVGDEDCLAASISRLMSDAALRMELSDGARTFAQQFSHRHTAEKTLQVYREVLQ